MNHYRGCPRGEAVDSAGRPTRTTRDGGTRTSSTSAWKSAPATSLTARVVSARALQATRAGAASALREAHRYGARRDTRAPSAALGAKVAAMSASVDSFGREGAASERGRAVVETRARM